MIVRRKLRDNLETIDWPDLHEAEREAITVATATAPSFKRTTKQGILRASRATYVQINGCYFDPGENVHRVSLIIDWADGNGETFRDWKTYPTITVTATAIAAARPQPVPEFDTTREHMAVPAPDVPQPNRRRYFT